MRLTRTASYALAATLQLPEGTDAGPLPCRLLARQGAMPERFLLQILRVLVNRGILASVRGVDGGYRLARPLAQITLLEIVEAVDGPLAGDADNGSALARPAQRVLATVLQAAASDVRERLASVTLDRLQAGGSDDDDETAWDRPVAGASLDPCGGIKTPVGAQAAPTGEV